ncbi:MAG: hypothetical protein ABI333_22745 [bacterium]
MRRSTGVAALLLSGAALSLASNSKKSGLPDDPYVSTSTAPADRPRPTRRPAVLRSLPYPPCPAAAGTIRREQLRKILDRSPGLFLTGVDLEMVPLTSLPDGGRTWKNSPAGGKAGRFGGWRIKRFHPGDPCLDRAGILPGDIVVSLNDVALRRPGDLLKVWQALRKAPRLVVRLYRDSQPMVFVVRVQD